MPLRDSAEGRTAVELAAVAGAAGLGVLILRCAERRRMAFSRRDFTGRVSTTQPGTA